jgi:hypothetical protein
VTGGTVSLRALLKRPVMLRDIELGSASDAVLDSESLRVVGLEVACGDDVRRFLPLAAARLREDRVAVGSAQLLLDEAQREFYRRHSRPFRSLLGVQVARKGSSLGELVDLVVTPDGTVEAVSARTNGTRARLYPRAEVTIAPARKATAA